MYVAAFGLAAASAGSAQVLSPPEIRDAQLRELQLLHFADLKKVANEIKEHTFPYRVCFSRTLDLNEAQQQNVDQRSIRFDKFHDQTVLEITANYYASYSAETMRQDQRAQRTLEDVTVPMLQAAIPALSDEGKLQAFAIEISQHVRKKVLGVTDENSENIAFVLPVAAAKQLMAAATPADREVALMGGQLFVNRQPVPGWGQSSAPISQSIPAPVVVPTIPVVAPRAEVSTDNLRGFQSAHQSDLDGLVRDLDKQAHFVVYAPPAFIEFRKRAYLQLSMKTMLNESAAGSQYEMAALAFDEHIAHLIRPVMTALKNPDFDGIDFSTSVRFAGAPEGTAIEFILPLDALRSYQDYDLTGQQLISKGVVLINGERVGLDLQTAEAGLAGQH
jgi:hypothetical protein